MPVIICAQYFSIMTTMLFVFERWIVVISRRKRMGSVEASVVTQCGTTCGADLGGSSNYSSGTLEDQSGEGFHGNGRQP